MLLSRIRRSIDNGKRLEKGASTVNRSSHTLGTLFEQLGLQSSPQSIDDFLLTHSPLSGEISLCEAKFWSRSQATFLQEAINDDSEWALIADQLSQLLRKDT